MHTQGHAGEERTFSAVPLIYSWWWWQQLYYSTYYVIAFSVYVFLGKEIVVDRKMPQGTF